MRDYEKQISKDIDEMTPNEKRFALWLLLKDYRDNNILELKTPKTKEEFCEYKVKSEIMKGIEELTEILAFEMW